MGDGNRQGMGTGNKFLRQYQGVRILTRTHVQLRSVQLSPPCLWLRRLFERYVSGALYSPLNYNRSGTISQGGKLKPTLCSLCR